MSALKEILIERIKKSGALNIAQFMTLALSHPTHGYYIKQDPFGQKGDFITAPEISQIFGEIIGIWCLQQWVRMETPSPIILVEGGPGRGTLMKDLIRGSSVMEEFHYAADIHLIETSPTLRSIQKQTLSNDDGKDLTWHDDISSLPPEPLFFVANELFDALPIQQFIKQDGQWSERVVTLDDQENITFSMRESNNPPIPDDVINAEECSIYEYCPLAHIIVKQLCSHLKSHGGIALLIDYGHLENQAGDTFQAIKNHQYTNVLEHIGDSDLTAHVNFDALAKTAQENGVQTTFMTQRDFLLQNGIEVRARQLLKDATPEQAEVLNSALDRLVSPEQMGTLFKVMVLHV